MTDARRILPFLWLHGEDEATLREGVRRIAASGCGSLCAESRTHPDYLGEGWWRELSILTDECRRQGMTYWVMDDAHFPSGYANGAAQGTPWARMLMTERHMDVSGPCRGGAILAVPDGKRGMLTAVVAARRVHRDALVEAHVDIGGWAVSDPIDLTDRVEDGLLHWDVPEGDWRVFVLTADYVSERNPPRFFVNPLLPKGGQLMLSTVYEAHYAHLADAFGTTFRGFFSDEPALRAGRGCRAVLGEYPQLPIPWRPDLPELLSGHLGEPARRLLPGLWYDIGDMTPRIRYALMDTVSRLYAENYARPIGDWCRAHGVEYIGHVIEQNNAHSRLGQGAGHYFRAMSGQDMAGMDLVLHELKPEFRDASHAWHSQDFEADDDFFRHMLPQMTVSCAHLDPRKRGRSLCELFGAYGWQEDAAEMRYIANFLLSRGVNHFTPHAFTLKPFPDPDSPPHFGSFNPLMPALTRLHGHMARVGSLIDGGRMLTRVGVLYHAEAEWADGKSCMKTQQLVKALEQAHIPCEIVPIDLMQPGRYDALYIPRAKHWPLKLFDRLTALSAQGCQAVFVDAAPIALSEGQGDIRRLTAPYPVLPLSEIAEHAARCTRQPVRALTVSRDIHLYLYEKHGEVFALLFNEDVRAAHAITLTADAFRQPVLWDSEGQCCHAPEAASAVEVTVEPGQLLVLCNPQADWPAIRPPVSYADAAASSPCWTITFSDAALPALYTDAPRSISLIHPRFSGTVRYTADIPLTEGFDAFELRDVSGSVGAWADGQPLGWRDAPPYRFPCPLDAGSHRLTLEITVPPVFTHRDPLSFYSYLKPAGLTGPIHWLKRRP